MGVLHCPLTYNPGTVDKDINSSNLHVQVSNKRAEFLGICKVDLKACNLRVLLNSRNCLCQGYWIPSDQAQLHPLARQRRCNRTPDPAARASYDCHLPNQLAVLADFVCST